MADPNARQGVSVTTDPTRLDNPDSPGASKRQMLVVAQQSGTLVLGTDNHVTSAVGVRVAVVAGTTISFDLDRGEGLWACVATGSIAVDVLTVPVS